jgi:hypothetical protein
MRLKSTILMFISSVLATAVYTTSTNFASAASSECFGDVNSLGSVICVGTTEDGRTIVFECTVTQNPYHVDCHSLNKVSIPAGVKANIDASVQEELQSNTHDTKNLGDLKNDNLQIQERKAGEVPKQFQFPNKTLLAP